MLQTPDAQGLLAIARSTLLEHLLPQLPEEARYAALMVANAMAIAARAASTDDDEAELRAIAAWLGADGAAAPASVTVANRRLSDAIRAGRMDAPDDAAKALLTGIARRRVTLSAPKVLNP